MIALIVELLADVDGSRAAVAGGTGDRVGDGVQRDVDADHQADADVAEILRGRSRLDRIGRTAGDPAAGGEPSREERAEDGDFRCSLRHFCRPFSETSDNARGVRHFCAGVALSDGTLRSAERDDGDSWAPVSSAPSRLDVARVKAAAKSERPVRKSMGRARSPPKSGDPSTMSNRQVAMARRMRRCLTGLSARTAGFHDLPLAGARTTFIREPKTATKENAVMTTRLSHRLSRAVPLALALADCSDGLRVDRDDQHLDRSRPPRGRRSPRWRSSAWPRIRASAEWPRTPPPPTSRARDAVPSYQVLGDADLKNRDAGEDEADLAGVPGRARHARGQRQRTGDRRSTALTGPSTATTTGLVRPSTRPAIWRRTPSSTSSATSTP